MQNTNNQNNDFLNKKRKPLNRNNDNNNNNSFVDTNDKSGHLDAWLTAVNVDWVHFDSIILPNFDTSSIIITRSHFERSRHDDFCSRQPATTKYTAGNSRGDGYRNNVNEGH